MKTKFLSLFTLILISTTISTAQAVFTVIPSGEAVGIAVKTKGLLVTGITEITNADGNSVNAAYKAGVRKGDIITAVDGNVLKTNEELADYVVNRPNKIILTIERKSKIINLLIKPVKTNDGYKLGIWVRDSTAGIGTLTFINPHDKTFSGLGHSISDVDTNDILTIRDGNILKCDILEPTTGKKGVPGELNGAFSNESLGKITSNSESGIFGEYSKEISGKPIEVAEPDEIQRSKALILSNVDGNGVKAYDIEIKKISKRDLQNRNLVIEVTDQQLLDKTGGIVQGMSGSPIIQNGKLIGAVTHVFVNAPTKGYGIFIENMLNSK